MRLAPRGTARGLGRSASRGRLARVATAAIGLALLLALGSLIPLGPGRALIPVAAAHALLVRSEPAARQVLQTPPSRVRMWFSEDLNPLTSRAVVVDPTNKEVDNHNSEVSRTNPREMDVELPLLPAGTYVVAWRTQSADDGHIVAGSFYFQIARPDGTVPPLPHVLPTGHIPGAGGAATGGGLDGPGWLQAISTWLALVFMTFWVGGLIWETWILSPVGEGDADLAAAARRAGARFRRLAPWALGGILVADVGMVLALSAELAGDWSGLISGPLLRAVVFGSQFGAFWWLRQIVAGAALALVIAEARGVPTAAAWRAEGTVPKREPMREPTRLSAWGPWLLTAARRLPRALARAWRARTWAGRAALALGATLLVAFALSGHAAAVASSERAYALSVDLLHLLGTAIWAGGLLYIAFVLIPALRTLPDRQRASVLARGLPAFSAAAIATVLVLAATGTLNSTIHLTSVTQLLTTTYGITLAVKIEIFLVMAAISAYHAFRVRPRLLKALETSNQSAAGVTEDGELARGEAAGASVDGMGAAGMWNNRSAGSQGGTRGAVARLATAVTGARASESSNELSARPPRASSKFARRPLSHVVGENKPLTSSVGPGDGAEAVEDGWHDDSRENRVEVGGPAANDSAPEVAETAASAGDGLSVAAARLTAELEQWLRREAILGIGVLLCVALLAAFAGSLTPAGASSSAPAPHVYVSAPQSAGGLTIILKVVPATFGTNTFTVSVRDAAGNPVAGAGVLVTTQMLDMDMGVQTAQLQAMPENPGVYTGQSDLDMAGHWGITVKVLPAHAKQFQLFSFKLTATY